MDAEFSKRIKLDSLLHDGRLNLNLHSLSLKDLREITNDFSDENILGRGGFGTVYKGLLQNGNIIAVKKLITSTMPGLQDKQYEIEVRHLMRLKHPNIVQLVGYCSETEKDIVEYKGKYVYAEKSERLLLLEYMPKGSLRNHISDASSGLDWNTRYKIIVGIYYGLHYLHEEWEPSTPIIHRDLKPANILLDNNMVPKIADFSLSRLFSEEQTRTTTKNFGGTLGYMAPEYLDRGIISKELDIFSLGVIIIQVVTGQKHYPYNDDKTSSKEFIELVVKEWRNRLEKVPGYTSQEFDCHQIGRCIDIGLLCVTYDRAQRPTTRRIIEMLALKYAESSNEREARSEHAVVIDKFSEPSSTLSSSRRNAGKVLKKRHAQKMMTQRVRVSLGTAAAETPVDDCHSWRKYGQKDILGAKYPRGYYRCVHRHSQGCRATKQVQRADEDPTLFDVIYHGEHTCVQPAHNPEANGLLKSLAAEAQGWGAATPLYLSSSTPASGYPATAERSPFSTSENWGVSPATSDSDNHVAASYPPFEDAEWHDLQEVVSALVAARAPPPPAVDGFEELVDLDIASFFVQEQREEDELCFLRLCTT